MTEQINIGAKHTIEIGTDAQGRATAKLFLATPKGPKTKKNYWFRNAQSRDEWAMKIAAEILENERAIAERKAQAKADAKNHTIAPGTIFCHSWGYEQTNIDFYQVVSVRGQMLELREVRQHTTERNVSGGYVIPCIGEFTEKPAFKKRIKFHSGSAYVSMPYGWCNVWDGREMMFTNYA